jgi:hypothetical protein
MALVAVPRAATASNRVVVRTAPFDRGCLAAFQPQAVVGCVAPLETAKSGKLVGASFPTACVLVVPLLPRTCNGQVAEMSLVALRQAPARYMPEATVVAHRRGTLPAVENYRDLRPQLCLAVLTGTPKQTEWASCAPLQRKGRTTVRLAEGGHPLSGSTPAFLAAVIFGYGSAQIDRVSYSLSPRS